MMQISPDEIILDTKKREDEMRWYISAHITGYSSGVAWASEVGAVSACADDPLFMSWLHQGSGLFYCIIDAGVRIAEVIQWEGVAKWSEGLRAWSCRGWEEGIGHNRSQGWVDTEYVSSLAIANQMSSIESTVSSHELDENLFVFFLLFSLWIYHIWMYCWGNFSVIPTLTMTLTRNVVNKLFRL